MNFYKEAAKILDKIESKKGSVKGCLSLAEERDRKRLGALILETLKMKPVILAIIEATPMMRDERRHVPCKNLAILLVHDLLFTHGGIQAADGPIKQAIHRHKTRLQAELVKLKIRKGVHTNQELAQPNDPRASTIPRYLRVNRNKWSAQDAVEYYTAHAYIQIDGGSGLPSQNQFVRDKHVPDLFIFNPAYPIHSDDAYNTGKMLAQDKASCLPALVLNPPASDDTHVIDATAAPGNKTSHLSALMGNKGKIFAFEKNQRRFKTLEQMLSKAGCENVRPLLGDFLSQDPRDKNFRKVTHILLDPSCSGSGIVNRLDYLTQADAAEDNSESRLVALSAFQKRMILHAMQFPAVTRIVYSTCSVNVEENEAVVREVLEDGTTFEKGFGLAPRSQVLSRWARRGISHEGLGSEQIDALIRCSPGEDEPGTNGFFVACFVRDYPVQTNKTSSSKRKRVNLESGEGSKRRKFPKV